jgi:hypothetical protein
MTARFILLFVVLSGLTAQSQTWRSLFNGKDLNGWKQVNGPALYEVINGELVGTAVDSPVNSFLATEEEFGDFILELEFLMDSINSGIQIRSERKENYLEGRVYGYQVEFDPTPRAWTGGIYDESRRGWIYPLEYNPFAKTAYKHKQWNHCRIEAIGNNIRVWINGIPTSHIIDDLTPKGILALQVHGIYRKEDIGLKIRWKNIRIQTKNLKPSPPERIFIANLIEARDLNAKGKGFQLIEKPSEKKVDVMYNNKLITAYLYQDSVMKPVLYPVNTLSGTPITREYPFKLKPGERADHPHQVGIWFAHEHVNGIDFWNASTAIPPKDRHRYGKIIHTRTVCAQGLASQGTLIVNTQWRTQQGKTLLAEVTTIKFSSPNEHDIVIDRTTELRAMEEAVTFLDRKDALMAIRVARELELPSEWKEKFIMPDGSITPEPIANREGTTGDYLNSNGVTGEAVFGKRAQWMRLTGTKDNQKITIALINHPENIDSPPYWLARGYGLMAANPLGKSIFTEGKDKLNYELPPQGSVLFHYRFIIREGKELDVSEIQELVNGLKQNR